ncbi:hypothetical protein RFI_03182, partial [Reticulomyxa filosa]
VTKKKKRKVGQKYREKKSIIVKSEGGKKKQAMTDFRVNTLTLFDEILLPLCSGGTIRQHDLYHSSNEYLYESTERKLSLILANERISCSFLFAYEIKAYVYGQPIEREKIICGAQKRGKKHDNEIRKKYKITCFKFLQFKKKKKRVFFGSKILLMNIIKYFET